MIFFSRKNAQSAWHSILLQFYRCAIIVAAENKPQRFRDRRTAVPMFTVYFFLPKGGKRLKNLNKHIMYIFLNQSFNVFVE